MAEALWRGSWLTYSRQPPRPQDFLWKWRKETPARSAALLSLISLTIAAASLGIPAITFALNSINTPAYAAVSTWTLGFSSILVSCLLVPIVWQRLSELLSSRWVLANQRLFLPGSLLLLALITLQLGALTLALSSRRWADGIAWVYFFAPALSLTLMLPLGVPLINKVSTRVRKMLCAILLAFGIIAAVAPKAMMDSLRSTSVEPGFSNLWARALSAALDVDGDQVSGLYGVADCGPFAG